jgi:hypothetical protein
VTISNTAGRFANCPSQFTSTNNRSRLGRTCRQFLAVVAATSAMHWLRPPRLVCILFIIRRCHVRSPITSAAVVRPISDLEFRISDSVRHLSLRNCEFDHDAATTSRRHEKRRLGTGPRQEHPTVGREVLDRPVPSHIDYPACGRADCWVVQHQCQREAGRRRMSATRYALMRSPGARRRRITCRLIVSLSS